MVRFLIAAALAATLSACAAGIPAALQVGLAAAGAARAAYCVGVAEGGKRKVRDLLTAGEQVIACDSGAGDGNG